MAKTGAKKTKSINGGLVHAYIGYGKGKTTAAIGVAVRARGYGWRVLFLQFMKSLDWPSGERQALKKLGVQVRVMGAGFYKIMDDKKSVKTHKLAAEKALTVAKKAIFSAKFQLVVLDELGTAVEEGLLSSRVVGDMLKQRSVNAQARRVNIIWTGHKKIPALLKSADLISEMKPIRHPFSRGQLARQGLDY